MNQTTNADWEIQSICYFDVDGPFATLRRKNYDGTICYKTALLKDLEGERFE